MSTLKYGNDGYITEESFIATIEDIHKHYSEDTKNTFYELPIVLFTELSFSYGTENAIVAEFINTSKNEAHSSASQSEQTGTDLAKKKLNNEISDSVWNSPAFRQQTLDQLNQHSAAANAKIVDSIIKLGQNHPAARPSLVVAFAEVQEFFVRLFAQIAQFFSDMIQKVSEWLKDIWSRISNFFTNLANLINRQFAR